MHRAISVWFFTLAAICCLVPGCGGGGGESEKNNFEFTLTTWHSVDNKMVPTVRTEKIPILAQGEQFSLSVRDRRSGEIIPFREVTQITFWKNEGGSTPMMLFTNVVSWEDVSVGKFFRVDEQFPKHFFAVAACVKGRTVTRYFQVVCPDQR